MKVFNLILLIFISVSTYAQVSITGASDVIEKEVAQKVSDATKEQVHVTKESQSSAIVGNNISATKVNYGEKAIEIDISSVGATSNAVKPLNALANEENYETYKNRVVMVTEKPEKVTSTIREEFENVVETPTTVVNVPATQKGVIVNLANEEVNLDDFKSSTKEIGVVYFGLNSNDVEKTYYKELAATFTYLKNNPSATLVLTGYTDVMGGESYSSSLSESRVTEVYRLLAEVFKIPSIKLEKFHMVSLDKVPNAAGYPSNERKVSIRVM